MLEPFEEIDRRRRRVTLVRDGLINGAAVYVQNVQSVDMGDQPKQKGHY